MVKLIEKCRLTHLKQAKAILKYKDLIMNGTMMSVDPSSKSLGLNIYVNGEHQEAILIKCDDPSARIGVRLKSMYEKLPYNLDVDVMIIELVRPQTGHIYLTWAAALCIIKYGPKETLELSAGAWQKIKPTNYIKSDVLDSKLIGNFAITICKEDDE